MQKTQISKSDMVKWALQCLKSREMGMPEIMDRLLGHPLHWSDVNVKFLATNESSKRVR